MATMTNKVALVVGGAKGIGLAIASRLANEGAIVFVTGRSAEEVETAAAKIGRGARALVADAAGPADLERAVATVRDLHGRIDALVLNAGVSEPAGLADETPEHFDRHFAVNVRGPMFGLQAAAQVMNRGGAVVLSARSRVRRAFRTLEPTPRPRRRSDRMPAHGRWSWRRLAYG